MTQDTSPSLPHSYTIFGLLAKGRPHIELQREPCKGAPARVWGGLRLIVERERVTLSYREKECPRV